MGETVLGEGAGHVVPPVFDVESPTGVAPIVVPVAQSDFKGEAVAYWGPSSREVRGRELPRPGSAS